MPIKRHARTVLTAKEAGQPVLQWLADRFTYHTYDGWADIVGDERIRVNAQTIDADYITTVDDVLEYFPDSRDEPEVILDYELIYDDDNFLVINKPPNLPCHPSGSFFNNTLWAMLTDTYGDVHVVNRLDRETSGLVLISRNKATARELGTLFAHRTIQKQYLVLVHGEFPDTLAADGFLVKDQGSEVRKKKAFQNNPDDDGDACSTRFVKIAGNNGFSLVQALPKTGKFHQIRATISGLGYPVVGDKIYGVDDTIFVRFVDQCMTPGDHERLMIDHQALHAWRLSFELPGYGELSFEAPLPESLNHLMKSVDLTLAAH